MLLQGHGKSLENDQMERIILESCSRVWWCDCHWIESTQDGWPVVEAEGPSDNDDDDYNDENAVVLVGNQLHEEKIRVIPCFTMSAL